MRRDAVLLFLTFSLAACGDDDATPADGGAADAVLGARLVEPGDR